MSVLTKIGLAICAVLVVAPLAFAMTNVGTPAPTPAAVQGLDAGLPVLPDMSMRPTASLAR